MPTACCVGDQTIDAVKICGVIVFNFQTARRGGGARQYPHLSPQDPSEFRFGRSYIRIGLCIDSFLLTGSFRTVEKSHAPFGFPHGPIMLENLLREATLHHWIVYA